NLYLARLNLAQAAVKDSEARRVRQLLTEMSRPVLKTGPQDDIAAADQHGFEWYYLQKLNQSGQLDLKEHINLITAVAFSRDGKRLASGGEDRTVRRWDLTQAKELLVLQGHAYEVTAVAFSPDGNRLASGSKDKTVKVWDMVAGKPVQTLTGHTGWVTCIAFNPFDQRLVSGSWDRN